MGNSWIDPPEWIRPEWIGVTWPPPLLAPPIYYRDLIKFVDWNEIEFNPHNHWLPSRITFRPEEMERMCSGHLQWSKPVKHNQFNQMWINIGRACRCTRCLSPPPPPSPSHHHLLLLLPLLPHPLKCSTGGGGGPIKSDFKSTLIRRLSL